MTRRSLVLLTALNTGLVTVTPGCGKDTDSDTVCECHEQSPTKFGDCAAGDDLVLGATTIAEVVDLECYYYGPSEPSAEAEIDYVFENQYVSAVIKGPTGWSDFIATCTEPDFPVIDFESQRVVFLMATYEWDCTHDGYGASETRIGDLDDNTVQVNGYLYNMGTYLDCSLDGFGLQKHWLVILNTTNQIRTCLKLVFVPPG